MAIPLLAPTYKNVYLVPCAASNSLRAAMDQRDDLPLLTAFVRNPIHRAASTMAHLGVQTLDELFEHYIDPELGDEWDKRHYLPQHDLTLYADWTVSLERAEEVLGFPLPRRHITPPDERRQADPRHPRFMEYYAKDIETYNALFEFKA